ncbi:MAG TPA: hypothetical protein VF062_07220 [Candidatus Limnocylindrales bacterium]
MMPAAELSRQGQAGTMPPAVEEAIRQRCAAELQRAYQWLEETLPSTPALSNVVPAMITAVQLYQARQYTACLDEVNAVMSNLRQARWSFPTLPPL